jgi:hypothetical protein
MIAGVRREARALASATVDRPNIVHSTAKQLRMLWPG